MDSFQILEKLISYKTISINSNLELISFCQKLLENIGARIKIIPNSENTKSNLFATIGPENTPGIMLSGHTDVVPIEGQEWKYPAFKMTKKGNRLYGRGTADMKSFISCALHAAMKASNMKLNIPLHLAFSYDEEIGCVGVRSMIRMLKNNKPTPLFCIVGEPTSMQIASGHKGKVNLSVKIKGKEAHSALAPNGLNAIYLSIQLINEIQTIQEKIKSESKADKEFEVPYTTIEVCKIQGGNAPNIVPNSASFLFEIRNIPKDDPLKILSLIKNRGDEIISSYKKSFPEIEIQIDIINQYPSLNTPKNSEILNFLKSITGNNSTSKVSFGTEGGLFSNELNIPTAICGPGSMQQGHKPDEYIEVGQIEKCDLVLNNLLIKLEQGFTN